MAFMRLINMATLLFVISYSSMAQVQIGADDDGFLYTGRVDFKMPKQPWLSWPGSSIKATFTGDELVIIFDDQLGKNYYNVILNGDDQFPTVLELKKGRHEYDLSYLLTNTASKVNELEIFKRTEGHEGGTHFLGLKLADKANLLAKPKALKRRIAFFGDSITSGMGNEAPDNAKDNIGADKNHYWSYAPITARHLNAEFHTISSSGIGFMVSWFDHVMPQVYDQISGVGDNDTVWDFAQWQPDVVVINLGQNDSWLIDNEKRLQPEPSPKDITAAYKRFVLRLMTHYPNARFVSVLGSMDATHSKRAHWPRYIQTALNEINAENPTANIELIQFDFTGYRAHPRVKQHINNAKKLIAHIKKVKAW
ncbi:SGNH/GDSL hydrolase family protein [Algibacillus agarilyticus]|uniref:SGNH/GDSL hydrolase family protein n=1 Tax=Algibacillus agarilyticus TaxID=2234133 RepID=UPI000DCF974A|nr:SGNH/GDSL hydrolase family protein [Algibacillus agarilyticus]